MKSKLLLSICVLLCIFLLNSCFFVPMGPSLDFQIKEKLGLYPTTADFPNTKWVCREIDLYLYMFDYEESTMIGEYTHNGICYRVTARFEINSDLLSIDIYSDTDISKSKYSNSMVHCEPISCGFIYSNYFFDKDTETIVCSIRNSMSVDGETIPNKLTFEKVGTIELNQKTRWYAQELDMYLDSFHDVNGYYSGEIMLEGTWHYIHALEVGNNNYYALSIANDKLNNLRSGTTYPLIYMYFEIKDDKITAMVCDNYLAAPVAFPYWSYSDTIITFTPSPKVEK